MSEQMPQVVSEADDQLSPEELEEVAGGLDTNTGVCNTNCATACVSTP